MGADRQSFRLISLVPRWSANLALADPGLSGFGWFASGAHPVRNISSYVAGRLPSDFRKTCSYISQARNITDFGVKFRLRPARAFPSPMALRSRIR